MAARPSRILIVSLRRIGDLLLTTPVIRSVRRAWPEAQIDVLVFDGTAGIIAGNPDIDHILTMPQRPTAAESLRLIRRLWRSYDVAVSTQSGDRPTVFAFAAGRWRVGVTTDTDRWLARALKRIALHRAVPAAEKLHRVEQNLRLVDALDIPRVPELVCPAAAQATAVAINGKYAVIHAAPMFAYKEWTPDGWRAVAANLAKRGLTIIAIGGPGEAERRPTRRRRILPPRPDARRSRYSAPRTRASGGHGRLADWRCHGRQAAPSRTEAMSGSCRIPCRACLAPSKAANATSAAAAFVSTSSSPSR